MKKTNILLPIFLMGMAISAVQAPQMSAAHAEFVAKYTDRTAYIKAGSELNGKICDEGFTLLKNLDGYLPMYDATNISVFGKSSTSLVYGGGGSGSGRVNGETQIDLQKSLTNVGFKLNKKLTDFYSNNSKSGSGRTNGNSNWTGISQVTIGETPLKNYDDALIASFDDYNDAAIMVISREGSEGCDVKTCDCRDSNSDPVSERHALQLSQNEEDLFNLIKEHFDNIIILINSGNIFQCDMFEHDDQVKGILWMGTPGAVGAGAVGRILKGLVNPSGHTVDTWARDFTKDPTFQNFSDNSQTNPIYDDDGNLVKYSPQDTMFNPDGSAVRADGSYKGAPKWDDKDNLVVKAGLNGVRPSAYVSYEEGVYMDYRYYETYYADLAAKSKKKANEWYDGEYGVIYPFGYGLSYTTFSQKIVGCTKAGQSLSDPKEKMIVQVEVTNTGDWEGKDVIQLYWKAPYKKGGIEKAYETLAAFDKTDVLEPGESKVYDLEFYIADVANYDFSDANNNGFMGYELDAGNYEVSINKNAHEVYDYCKFKVADGGIKFETDRVTGYKVENRFSGQDFYSSLPTENDIGFQQFSRANFDESKPTAPTIEERTLKEGSRVEEFYTYGFKLADFEAGNYDYVPEAAHKTKADIEALGWSQVTTAKSKADSISANDMVGLPMDDPKWESFMNDLTWSEMISFVAGGGTHNPAISRCDKPSTGDSDGPSQFQIIWWVGAPIVAATFNVELAYEQGEMVGIEGRLSSTYGWAGPGVNLHRSPFGGRNFEYYSADAVLSGKICGRVVAGATEKGVYCFFKHFAVNDQERNREGVSAFLTEQALRELYLKAFQIAIQEGKSTGIMSSYNRLGLMETAASYPLLTEVLRNEWGFKGSIISDMTHNGNSAFDHKCYENINNRILAGDSNQLDSKDYKNDMNALNWDNTLGAPYYTDSTGAKQPSYSWWYAVRTMAKECIFMCVNSGAMFKSFVAQNDAIEFANTIDNVYTAKLDEELEIEINAPYAVGDELKGSTIASISYSVDKATALPEGLELEDNVIKGTPTVATNQFVRVFVTYTLASGSTVREGRTFELFVTENLATSEILPPVRNAGGLPVGAVVGVSVGAVVLVAVAAVVVVMLLKKKKVQQ